MFGFMIYDKTKVEYVTGEIISVSDEVHLPFMLNDFIVTAEPEDVVWTGHMPKPWQNDFGQERQGIVRVETIGAVTGTPYFRKCKKLKIDMVLHTPEISKINELCEKKYRK